MPLLEIRDLIVRYGEIEALRGVSIGVDEGQVVTLLGANGAGKSTTLRMLVGLTKPTSGTATIDGQPYWALEQPARSIGTITCRPLPPVVLVASM